MSSDEKVKIIIIAPFWGKSDYIGRYRVERIVRWLTSDNYNVSVIWSGMEDNIIEKDKWIELEIRDPLRRFTRRVNDQYSDRTNNEQSTRKRNFRYFIQKIVFYFDRDLVWSLVLINKSIVKNFCKDAEYIISSSPPESIHLASYLLSKKFKLKLIVDMRDGWLDESMRPNIGKHSFKRMIEAKCEFRVLKQASVIFVTSTNWADMLKHRIPITDNKVTILTNAYPVDLNIPDYQPNREKLSHISLLHAGRFLGTRCTNRMSILLEPLCNILKSKNELAAEIILLGDLLKNDFEELKYWKQQFINTRTRVITKNRMPRNEMYAELANADGLLLLAATKAFFPSKTFEYIKSAKPILAVTSKGSTIWEIGQNLPQMFLYDFTIKKPDYTPIEEFLNACQTGIYEYDIPIEYSEKYLSKIFLDTIKNV